MLNGVKLQLSQQYAPRRWRAWLDSVTQAIERGTPLDAAIGRVRSSAPQELGALVDSALAVGDPAQLILEALRSRVSLRSHWLQLGTMLLYPVLTLIFAIVIGIMFTSLVDLGFLEEFGLTGADQVLATVADQRHAILGLAFVVGWTILAFGTIAMVGPAWALSSVLGGVRVFGRPLRWIHLSEILHRYQLFIGQGLTTVDAASAVTRSFANSAQRYASQGIENRLLQGASLGDALASTSLSDALCRPSLRLLDHRGSDLSVALAETSELLQQLVEQRCRSLQGVVPLFVLLIVGTLVWSFFTCYFLAFALLSGIITSLV
jgi:type II secretory pathway component PulF